MGANCGLPSVRERCVWWVMVSELVDKGMGLGVGIEIEG